MDITRLRLQFDQATKNLENKKKKLKELRTFYKKLQDEELFSEIYVLYRNKYIDQLDDDEKVLNKIISEKKLQINKLEKQIKDFSKSNNFKAKILKSEEILVAKEKNEFLQSVKCSNSQNTPAEILNFSLNRLKEIKELNRKLESLENEYENKNFLLQSIETQKSKKPQNDQNSSIFMIFTMVLLIILVSSYKIT